MDIVPHRELNAQRNEEGEKVDSDLEGSDVETINHIFDPSALDMDLKDYIFDPEALLSASEFPDLIPVSPRDVDDVQNDNEDWFPSQDCALPSELISIGKDSHNAISPELISIAKRSRDRVSLPPIKPCSNGFLPTTQTTSAGFCVDGVLNHGLKISGGVNQSHGASSVGIHNFLSASNAAPQSGTGSTADEILQHGMTVQALQKELSTGCVSALQDIASRQRAGTAPAGQGAVTVRAGDIDANLKRERNMVNGVAHKEETAMVMELALIVASFSQPSKRRKSNRPGLSAKAGETGTYGGILNDNDSESASGK